MYNFYVFKDYLSSISWNEQAILLDQTINNNIVKRYPLKNSYQRAFLKNVIDILEKNFVEIHDNLYDTYCNILSVDDKEKYFYKHYNIDKRIISLKENKNFISEGTTGLCSWQASLALSQWCLNNKEYLKKRTILELGSGVGLVGLTALLNCEPKEFYWSDCHPKVLEILSENIRLNLAEPETEYTTRLADKSGGKLEQGVIEGCGSTENCDSVNRDIKETFRNSGIKSDKNISCGSHTYTNNSNRITRDVGNFSCYTNNFDSKNSSGENSITETINAFTDIDNSFVNPILFSSVFQNTKVCVVNLPWESVQENQEYRNINPDLILAADVVYDNSVFKPLCGAVKFFLDLNKKCEIIFACTERNTDTLKEFLQLLGM